MSANFTIIADAVFFYDGAMESHFEFIAPNIYNKIEIGTLFENIDLSSYYDKTEVDTLLMNTNLTGSENLDITNNQISLTFPLKVNGEIVINPRAYGIQFDMYAATSGFVFLQNQQDGAQPIAIFNSLDKSVEPFGDLDIPNFYNKTEINSMLAGGGSTDFSNYYYKTEVDAIVANINFNNNHYTKSEVDDIDNELSAFILNTYTKTEIDTTLSDYSTTSHLQGNYMTSLSITQALMNNYASVTFIIDNFYSKTETDTLLADKLTNIGDISLLGRLDIGTSGYTNSRIRCNADIGGYTGYAELRAANSYDMFLNLQTTYPNGGWVYLKLIMTVMCNYQVVLTRWKFIKIHQLQDD